VFPLLCASIPTTIHTPIAAAQKKQTKRVRITVGGNRIVYPGKVAIKAAHIATVNLFLNCLISTPEAELMTLNIQDFYLNTPMKRVKYVRVALRDIHQAIIEQYCLELLTIGGFVYFNITKGM
jgi:hypothetical protein